MDFRDFKTPTRCHQRVIVHLRCLNIFCFPMILVKTNTRTHSSRNIVCRGRSCHLFVPTFLYSCVLSMLLVLERGTSCHPTCLGTTVGNSHMAIHSFVSSLHWPELFTNSSNFLPHLCFDWCSMWPFGLGFQPNHSRIEFSTCQLAGQRGAS